MYTTSNTYQNPFGFLKGTLQNPECPSKNLLDSYRYGFNGKEKDDETYGDGDEYDYGARIYDPRLGRWLSCDAAFKNFAPYSPYSYCFDSPLGFSDPDGNKPRVKWCTSEVTKKDGKTIITVHMQLEVRVAVINKSKVALTKAEGDEIASNLELEAPENTYTGTMEAQGYVNDLFKVSNDPNVVINYKVEISQSYRYVEKADDIQPDEEILVLVDEHAKNKSGVRPGGIAHPDIGVATSDIGETTFSSFIKSIGKKLRGGRTGIHEVGHLIGASDRYKRDKNGFVVDEGPKTTVMSAKADRDNTFDKTDIDDIVSTVLWDLALDKQRTKLFGNESKNTYKLQGDTYVPQNEGKNITQRINSAVSDTQKPAF